MVRILFYLPRRSRAAEGGGYGDAIGVPEHEDKKETPRFLGVSLEVGSGVEPL